MILTRHGDPKNKETNQGNQMNVYDEGDFRPKKKKWRWLQNKIYDEKIKTSLSHKIGCYWDGIWFGY